MTPTQEQEEPDHQPSESYTHCKNPKSFRVGHFGKCRNPQASRPHAPPCTASTSPMAPKNGRNTKALDQKGPEMTGKGTENFTAVPRRTILDVVMVLACGLA